MYVIVKTVLRLGKTEALLCCTGFTVFGAEGQEGSELLL
jgi:hypothetical protein